MATNLTVRYIEAIKPPPKDSKAPDKHWDSTIRSFGLFVYGTGRMTWNLMFRIDGNLKTKMLGVHPTVSVADARKRALPPPGPARRRHRSENPVRPRARWQAGARARARVQPMKGVQPVNEAPPMRPRQVALPAPSLASARLRKPCGLSARCTCSATTPEWACC